MDKSSVTAVRATSAIEDVQQLAADLLKLTKPKVQTLLLFTTLTTIEITNHPSIELIALTYLNSYLSTSNPTREPLILPRHLHSDQHTPQPNLSPPNISPPASRSSTYTPSPHSPSCCSPLPSTARRIAQRIEVSSVTSPSTPSSSNAAPPTFSSSAALPATSHRSSPGPPSADHCPGPPSTCSRSSSTVPHHTSTHSHCS